jgi:hypothetical protein
MIGILLSLFGYLAFACFIIIVVKAYELVYLPYKFKNHFSKYHNMYFPKGKYYLIGGFSSQMQDDYNNNRCRLSTIANSIRESPKSDFIFFQMGNIIVINVANPELIAKMNELLPSHIDKYAPIRITFGRPLKDSEAFFQTTEKFKQRRKDIMPFLNHKIT